MNSGTSASQNKSDSGSRRGSEYVSEEGL